ncbi:MAG: glycosyltransferase family 2 protein [Synechococcales cyanobacterium CRU_2_2]|nr:glycosyltransferase family 2 protein [Synechococcales cyanobacterium CRU_2_2]
MSHFAVFVLFLFIAPTLVVIGSSYSFIKFLRSPTPAKDLDDQSLPSAAVIMSVRGLDPSLYECVKSLLEQDYPSYLLKIVVDSEEDAAWIGLSQLIKDFASDTNPIFHAKSNAKVELVALKTRYESCGLKCSALIQAVSQLSPDLDVVAFVDSDVITHRTWLRELVSPLIDPNVGLTSGLPWYIPEEKNFGSRVRYLWNIYGLTGRYICRTPSGASMGIQRHLLTHDKILGIWQNVLSEDVTASVAVQAEGLEVRFVQSLIMVNRESCSLSGCWNFVKRQFFWTRLYSDEWNFIAAQAFFRAAALLSTALLLPAAYLAQQYNAILIVSFGLFFYFFSIGICVFLIQLSVQRWLISNGEKIFPYSILEFPKILLSFIIAHLIVLGGTLCAFGMNSIEWRGIKYQIKRNSEVKMLNYSPYKGSGSASNVSIL